MLYSWRFSHYSAAIHWLVHGHKLSTAKRHERATLQKPWRQTGNREVLTTVARDQSVQLKVAWCCRWNSARFSNFLLFCCAIWQITLWLVPWGTVNFVFSNLKVYLDFVRSTLTPDYNYDVIFLQEVASLYKNSGENKNNLNDTFLNDNCIIESLLMLI